MDTAEAQAYDDLLQLLMQSGQLTSAGRHIWQRQADPTMMVRTTQFQQVCLCCLCSRRIVIGLMYAERF